MHLISLMTCNTDAEKILNMLYPKDYSCSKKLVAYTYIVEEDFQKISLIGLSKVLVSQALFLEVFLEEFYSYLLFTFCLF